jgi:hypothetical protein
MFAKEPLKEPTGVRAALTMTMELEDDIAFSGLCRTALGGVMTFVALSERRVKSEKVAAK